MAKQIININDFDLFSEVIKTASKIVDSAKLTISQTGFDIFGARMKIARCEFSSNAVTADEKIEFSVEKLQLFLRVLQSVKEVHDGDYSGLKFSFDGSAVRFESKKFKTKFVSCNENVISQWISKKIEVEMTPVFEFTSSNDMIKRVNSHSFLFSDPKSVRVYLETKDDMENNAVFATIGNKDTELSNEMTLKFGLATFGSLVERGDDGLVKNERKIILDLERLNLFNSVQTSDIKFSLMSLNCLVSKASVKGKNNTFFNSMVCSTMLKN